jgi:tetratricopeptide (TPR) repeat protein
MRWASLWVCASLALSTVTLVVSPSAVAQVDSGSDDEARRRFDEGRTHFEAGEFTQAAQSFRRAYLLSPRFALLYNIGQAELRAGRDAEALEAFEGFLRQAPADDARRSEVEERVRVLRSLGVSASTGTVVATTTTPVETETETETETDPVETTTPVTTVATTDSGPGPAPWIVAGVGGAVAVVGAVLMGVGAADAASVTGAPDGTEWATIEGAAGRANAEFGAGVVMLGVGVVALGAGIVWGVVGGGSSESPTANVSFGPGSVHLSGTF